MDMIASTTAGSSWSSFGVWPMDRLRSLGPMYTPVRPGVATMASTLSSACTVSIMARVTMVSLARLAYSAP